MKNLALLSLVTVGVVACAPIEGGGSAGPSADVTQCFDSTQVVNFRVENRQQAYIRSQRGHVFRLDTPPNCFDPATSSISLEPDSGASPRMCPGQRVRVNVIDGAVGPRTCIATMTGPITDSSVSGLPGRG